jgi:hypothetical protein
MSAYTCPKCGIKPRIAGDPSKDKLDPSVTWIRYECGSYFMIKRVGLNNKTEFVAKCGQNSKFNPLG